MVRNSAWTFALKLGEGGRGASCRSRALEWGRKQQSPMSHRWFWKPGAQMKVSKAVSSEAGDFLGM